MEILTFLIVGGAIGGAFLYTVWPIARPQAAAGVLPDEEGAGPPSRRELARLLMDREQAYRNIMDIEFDREMGKLSDEDYAGMMAPARARAVEALRRLDARGVKEGMTPLRLNEREAAQAADRIEGGPPLALRGGAVEQSLDERLEAEILQYRKAPDEAGRFSSGDAPPDDRDEKKKRRLCASCGRAATEADNFCAACGHRLN